MTQHTTDDYLSAECAVAKRPEYKHLHGDCRRTEDVPLPGSVGVLLMRRCPCWCHGARTGAHR
ncbi:hypothetical protein PV381_07945 [Streptomyces scabiei]|uniref:hypothetical protein n=1 Tax=Streptomyces TaxID=1883 RepID=UPI001FF0E671|nr:MULTISPECIES: hypothetical protein [Streptomyces]MDX2626494.1 hypothetical protein [Streptomyces scabiei]MDX3028582.1 hypothetical protein [Streptomyces scabiei]MDX3207348.1 hypothetical protein [Streptomyces scabiei]